MQTITREECDEFRANPQVNPLTRRRIDPNGPTARTLTTRCDETHPVNQGPQTFEYNNVTYNAPDTARIVYDIGVGLWEGISVRVPFSNRRISPRGRIAEGFLNAATAAFGMPWVRIYHYAGENGDPMPNYAPPRILSLQECSQFVTELGNATRNNTPEIHSPLTLRPISPTSAEASIIRAQCSSILGSMEYMRLYGHVRRTTLAPAPAPAPLNHVPRRPPFTRQELEELRPHMSPTQHGKLLADVELWEQKSATPNVVKPTIRTLPEEAVATSCQSLLLGIDPSFETLIKRLKSMCNELSKECANNHLAELRARILQPSSPINLSLNGMSPTKTFTTVFNGLTASTTRRPVRDNAFRGLVKNMHVGLSGQEGVGEGVTRTAIQNILNDLKSDKFFVTCEEGGTRYTINDKLSVSDIRSMGYNVGSEEDVHTLYTIIGEFLAFCARNDIPVDMPLNRGLLAKMLYKDSEIDADEYVIYFLLDMPQTGTSMLNLLRNPDSIEYTGIEFNDDFPLVPAAENEELNATNFVKYLRLRAKHQLTHTCHPGGSDISLRLRALVDGFYIRNRLRRANATLPQLDKLLVGVPITLETFAAWLAATPTRISHMARGDQERRVLNWFMEILRDRGATLPLEELNQPEDISAEVRVKLYEDFLGKLMFFWSSLRKLDTTRGYQVMFIDNPLPKSSTCFYQIKLPRNVRSKDELYRKLVTATFNVEAGVGLMGGKRRS
jgi:hypothetical protein